MREDASRSGLGTAIRSAVTGLRMALIGVIAALLAVLLLAGGASAVAPPAGFGVTGLTTPEAGVVQTVTVTALNRAGRANSSYRGTVRLTSTDPQAVLPAAYTFTAADKGSHSFSVTLKTAGSQTVTATETAATGATGSQTATVAPAAPAALRIGSLSDVTAGVAQTTGLTARDAYGNVATSYRGTVGASSTDGKFEPFNTTFTAADAGSRTVSVTLKTAGAQSVTFRDAMDGALTVTSPTVTVSADAASALEVTGLADATAGTAQQATVTALDQFGNVAKSYRGTVALSSSDAKAVLGSPDVFTAADAGAKSFGVTLKTAGPKQSVSATDQGDASLSGQQTVAVNSGPAAALRLSTDLTGLPFEGSQVTKAGRNFAITVTAIDAFGNTAVGYRGQIRLTSSDDHAPFGAASLPYLRQFTAADGGTISIPDATFYEKRIYDNVATLNVADVSDAHISDTKTFQVLPGPAVRYDSCPTPVTKASGYLTPAAAVGVNDDLGLYFTARDAYGNDATNRESSNPLRGILPLGYDVNASLTTSDSQAANVAGAFFTGDRNNIGPTVTITFRTAGEQTVTVTDPQDSALTITCPYTVRGPRAFSGTVDVANPNTSRTTLNTLAASTYVPPNDSGFAVDALTGPYVDTADGLEQFGAVTLEGGGATAPALQWDLNPHDPAAGTITCDLSSQCNYTGPLKIDYRLRDAYGNTSDGQITINPWSSVGVPISNIPAARVLDGNSGTPIALNVGPSIQVPVNTYIRMNVINSENGSLTAKRDDGAAITLAVPDGLFLPVDQEVWIDVRDVDRTLTVGSYELLGGCDPAWDNVVCPASSFAPVTVVIPNGATAGDLPDLNNARIVLSNGLDVCFLGAGTDSSKCPSVGFTDVNALGGEGTNLPASGGGVPSAKVGQPYDFTFTAAVDPAGEAITFTQTGAQDSSLFRIPPGLTLESNGRLHGTPYVPSGLSTTDPNTYTFFVEARAMTSNSTATARVVLTVDPSGG